MESSDDEKEEHVQEVYEEVDESQIAITDRLIYHKKRGKSL